MKLQPHDMEFAHSREGNKRHVILVAEDDAEYRKMLNEMLSLCGHTVIAAADGTEAFELLRQFHVDVIVSDMNMPGCTGGQLHEMVRGDQNLQHTSFVYMTGLSILRAATPLAQNGLDYMVGKVPFDHLISLIDDLLVHRKDVVANIPAAERASTSPYSRAYAGAGYTHREACPLSGR